MKWVISINNMVYPLLPLPGKKGISNMIRSMKITNIKDIKYVLLNLMIFMIRRKMFIRNMINRNLVKETSYD